MKPLSELPITGSPEALAEVESLKKALPGSSFNEDVDWLLDDLDRAIFNEEGWGAPIAIAYALILETYYERESLDQLAGYYSDQAEPVPDGNIRFVEWAIKEGRSDLALKVRRSCLDASRRRFIRAMPSRDKARTMGIDDSEFAQVKNEALVAYDRLLALLGQLKQTGEIADLTEQRGAFEKEEFRKKLGDPTVTRIDEDGFWELLAHWREQGQGAADSLPDLLAALESLSPKALEQFNSIYCKTMRRLYHWDAWALAYVHFGGCSDDSFHEFRDTLIALGDKGLVDLAVESSVEAGRELRKLNLVSEFSLGNAIEAAMLARADRLPKQLETELAEPRGREWDEDKIAVIYPELATIYGYED